MREPESYWTRKGPPIPELRDLPAGTARSSGEHKWESLSPGMRRTVWREALLREAKTRGFSEDVLFRLRAATIEGGLSHLDDYLMLFERQDAARAVVREDVERLARADAAHAQSDVQIKGREKL